jgi:Domain of unknown function (DUF4202)
LSELLPEARAWVVDAAHPHARHLLRTEDWAVELEPGAGEALRLAAVLHDIERAFPDPDASWDSARDWDSPAYNRWHQDRSARIAAEWMRERGAPSALVEKVERLILVHEVGGWPEADVLQAADSLSFLETLAPLVVGWVESGRSTRERGAAKVQSSMDRMNPRLTRARELAGPMLRDALAAVAAAGAEAPR